MSAKQPIFDPAELGGLTGRNREGLAKAHAVTVALDRNAPRAVIDRVRSMGNGWALGIEMWERLGHAYLVLCASDRKRVRCGAPLILSGDDLALAVTAACQSLDGVTCAWLIYMAPDAAELANAMVLADARPEGHA